MYKFLDGKSYLIGAQSNKKDIERLKADVENLKDAARGKLYNEQVLTADSYSDVAYANTVPFATLDKVGGKTLVWNQLYFIDNYIPEVTVNGLTYKSNIDNSWTVSGKSTGRSNKAVGNRLKTYCVYGHKYYLSGCPQGGSSTTYLIGVVGYDKNNQYTEFPTNAYDTGNGSIFTPSNESTATWAIEIIGANNASVEVTLNNMVFTPHLIDLTVLFGAGNEPTDTSDTRIAMIESIFATHPEYKEPTLMDFSTESVVSNASITHDTSALARKYFPDGMRSAGSVFDELDLEHKVAIKRVSTFKANEITWMYRESYSYCRPINVKVNGASLTWMPSGIQRYYINPTDSAFIFEYNSRPFANEAEFLAAVENVVVNYELTEPVITPITEDIDPYIAVEGGGTVEFHNDKGDEYKVPVAHQMTYLTKVEV